MRPSAQVPQVGAVKTVILVDTSVWVDHLRRGEPALAEALENREVAMHPFVIGELACDNLPHRGRLFSCLGELPPLRSPPTPRCPR